MVVDSQQTFRASIALNSSPLVWSVNGIEGGNATVGTITSSGTYTAPDVIPVSPITVRAASSVAALSYIETTVSLNYGSPFIAAISPPTTSILSGNTQITLNGTGFSRATSITVNGGVVSSSFVSTSQMTATVPATQLAAAGALTITASNPQPGGGSTDAQFQVIAGTMNLVVNNLAAGALANINIGGPSGYSTSVNGSITLQNLPLGGYTISASPTSFGSVTYSASVPSQNVGITGAAPVSAVVEYSFIVPTTTKVLDDAATSTLVRSADGTTVSFSSASAVGQTLAPGDVIVAGSTSTTPNGLMAVVTSVQIIDTQIILTVRKATLTDVLQQGKLSVNQTLTSNQIQSAMARIGGVRVLVEERAPSETVEQSLPDSCSGNSATQVELLNVLLAGDANDPGNQLLASGTLELCPGLELDADIGWGLNSLTAKVTAGEHTHIQLSGTYTVTGELKKPILDVTWGNILVDVAGIPFVLSPTVTIDVGVSGTLAGQFSVGASQDAQGTIGFQYAGGILTPINSFQHSFAYDPFQASVTAEAKLFAEAEFKLTVDEILTPYVSLKPFVLFNADTRANPWWTLAAGLDGEIGVDLDLGFYETDKSWSGNLYQTNIANAGGPFLPAVVTVSSVSPSSLTSSSNAQTVTVIGTNFGSSPIAVLCSSVNCSTPTVTVVDDSHLQVTVMLNAGKWTIQVKGKNNSASNAYSFTVSPPRTDVAITSVVFPNPLIVNTATQTIAFTGSGFENGLQMQLCYQAICGAALRGSQIQNVTPDGSQVAVSATVAKPGLWTAQVINPDTSKSPTFSFTVNRSFAGSIAPKGGTINSTQFVISGSGASRGKTVTAATTWPDGSEHTTYVTADGNGFFQYPAFSVSKVGTYQVLCTDGTTGATAFAGSFVARSGLTATAVPSSGTVNMTSFLVTGTGATANGTVSVTRVWPDHTNHYFSVKADGSGNFAIGQFTVSEAGNYSDTYVDNVSNFTATLNFTAVNGATPRSSVSPQSGTVGVTSFTVNGAGATPNGFVTGNVLFPDGTVHVFKTQANSAGNYTFLPVIETATGTFTEVDRDDQSGGMGTVISWTVNQLNPPTNSRIGVFPLSFTPRFTVGESGASVGFTISSSTPGVTGTVIASTTSGGQWLTVDGHASYSWSAPETIIVTADPTLLGAGTYTGSLVIASSEASNSPITVPVGMVVSPPLLIQTTTLPDALGGKSYFFQMQASGGSRAGYGWLLESGYLPYGLSFDPGRGIISGIPANIGSSQILNLVIGVYDSESHISWATLPIVWRQPVSILPISPSNFQFVVGSTYSSGNSLQLKVFGGTAPFTWSASNLPPGMNLDSASGLFTGVPTTPGLYSPTITVVDARGESAQSEITLPVNVTSLTITASGGGSIRTLSTALVGNLYTQYLNGSGGSQINYVWSVTGVLPAGITASTVQCGLPKCGMVFQGTPTRAGQSDLIVHLTDSLGNTIQQTFRLIVNNTAPPQILTTSLHQATIGTAYVATLAASGGTPAFSYSLVGGSPDPSLQLTSDGTLSGNPSVANDCTGTWSQQSSAFFIFEVTDSVGNSNLKALCLTSYYPDPTITQISPPSITVDGQVHAISITGTNFRPSSVVVLGNSNSPASTTYVDSSTLSFQMHPIVGGAFSPDGTAIFGEGTIPVGVLTPYSDLASQSQGLVIYDPLPSITQVQAVLNNSSQPCTANKNCQLTITGTGFVYATTYSIVELGETLVSAGYPNSPLPFNTITTSAFSAPAGTYTLRISNPNQAGGGTAFSNAVFTIGP